MCVLHHYQPSLRATPWGAYIIPVRIFPEIESISQYHPLQPDYESTYLASN